MRQKLPQSQLGTYEDTLEAAESRYVTIAPDVIALLGKWRIEQGKYFLKHQLPQSQYFFTKVASNEPINPTSVTAWLNKFCKAHDLPHLNPHRFRHSQASVLISEGVDVVSVSHRLGHERVSSTTDIYAHILKKYDEKASSAVNSALYNGIQKISSGNA